ncbi:protein Loquacious-like [Halictus rubicundus]|uniref:protein Loquacious-like n=1 Tax=Halictus rubicundus TaxID=77578 RepID=UPI0040351EAC
MFKTPVSTLQEGLVKGGSSLPVYTEVSFSIGPQTTEFVICVTCDKYTAKGSGTTKKEAKQNAAKAMIELLASLNFSNFSALKLPTEQKALGHNLQSSINLSDSSSSSLPTCSEDIFTNYVGSLMEYCVKNRMPDPCFDVVSITGESHNLTFTMSCTIGSVSKQASATTKKAAKQNAAKEILQHLEVNTNCNSTDIDETSEITEEFMNLKLDLPSSTNGQEIEDVYTKLKNKPIKSVKHIRMKEYHIILANMFKHTFKMQMHYLKSLYRKGEYCTRNVTEIKAIIEDSLNASIKMMNIRSQKYDRCIVGVKLTTVPFVVQFGIDKTFVLAERKALNKLIGYIMVFSI